MSQLIAFLLIVWRLVTGTFVHSDFLGLLFSLISYVPQAVMDEQQLGTVPFALRFFVLSTFINVFYGVFGVALGQLSKGILMQPTMGLWPILFCDLVLQCQQNPDMPRGLCCLPIEIPSRWYPLVLIGIFSIFFGM